MKASGAMSRMEVWLETLGPLEVDDPVVDGLTSGDAVAPLLRAMDTVRDWERLGLVAEGAGAAWVDQLRKVLTALSTTGLLEVGGDFLSCAEALEAALSVLYPKDSVGAPLGEGPDPLGLVGLGEPMVLLSSAVGGPFPIDLIAELIGLLEAWREAQGPLPATLTPFFARLVRAVLGLQRGFTAQSMLQLQLALKQFIAAAGRHGISVWELVQKLHRAWASGARVFVPPASATPGAAAAAGGLGTAMLWFLAALLTLLVSAAVTHWALSQPIPGQKGLTYREFYSDLFFRKLSSGLISCGELQAEIARRTATFRRLYAQYERSPAPRTPHPLLLAEGNAAKTLIVTYLQRCGRSAGALTRPYLLLHRELAEMLSTLSP